MESTVRKIIESHNCNHYGWTALGRPLSMSFYESWLKNDYRGDMTYLEEHAEVKADPRKLLPPATSLISIGVDYIPHPVPLKFLPNTPIARYAQGRDYHFWFKGLLNRIAQDLIAQFPDHHFMTATDNLPVLERDWAYQSGLGWVGKNTCLINTKKGSLFLLGEIITSLPLKSEKTLPTDHCGTCTRCIDICPTDAFVEPKVLDATKCISYWTIEAKTDPPEHMRAAVGEWFFGCDLCQTVCPWNQKIFGDLTPKPKDNLEGLLSDMKWILNATNNDMEKLFAHSALLRPPPSQLRRNAILVAVHYGLSHLGEDIKKVGERYPKLREISLWALQNFGNIPQ